MMSLVPTSVEQDAALPEDVHHCPSPQKRQRFNPVDDSNTREQITGNAECNGGNARVFANAKNFVNHNTNPEDLSMRRQSAQDAANASVDVEIPPNPHQNFPEFREEDLRYIDQFLNNVSPEDLANILSS
jgi:hypothetical protein